MAAVDHGGILADQRDAAEQVADALARQPDPTLAARSDPWTLDRQLRQQIAEHERVLAGRPADRHEDLAAAVEELAPGAGAAGIMDAVAARTASQLDDLGPLAGLSRRGRDQRRRLRGQACRRPPSRRRRPGTATTSSPPGSTGSQQEQDAFDRFEATEGWRRDDIVRLRDQLDHHWAEVVAACVRADDPLAFGIDKLRHARTTIDGDRQAIDAGIPDDRADEWQQARRQLPELIRQRHQAEDDAGGRAGTTP